MSAAQAPRVNTLVPVPIKYSNMWDPRNKRNPILMEGDNMMTYELVTFKDVVDTYSQYPYHHAISFIKSIIERYIIENNLVSELKYYLPEINYGPLYNNAMLSLKDKYDMKGKTINQRLMTILDMFSILIPVFETRITGPFAERQFNICVNRKVPRSGVHSCTIQFYNDRVPGRYINERFIYQVMKDFKLIYWTKDSLSYDIEGLDFQIHFDIKIKDTSPDYYITTRPSSHDRSHNISPYKREDYKGTQYIVYK